MDNFRAMQIAEGLEEVDLDVLAEAWQHLIDSHLAWQLQGHFGRTAMGLIIDGVCSPPPGYELTRNNKLRPVDGVLMGGGL
jgi:hypothetical protein